MNTPPAVIIPLRPHRARGRLALLVALNAALLCATLVGLLTPRAEAQPGGGVSRPRGNYLMVSGRASGVSGNIVYIVDTVNQELLALRYQRAAGRLDPFGYRSLAADSAQGGRTR